MTTIRLCIPAILAMSEAISLAGDVTVIGSFEAHDYYLTNDALTVSEARIVAETVGQDLGLPSYLVAINHQQEQDWLNLELGFAEVFAIGLSDELLEGDFQWDNGEPLTFTFWAPGEPNDFFGVEDFVWMNWQPDGRWNDVNPDVTARAIIEVVPEPSSLVLICVATWVMMRRKQNICVSEAV